MKTIQTFALTLTTALTFGAVSAFAQLPEPAAPKLADALKYRGQSVAIFQPASMSVGQKLKVTHIRMGDGSVKPSPDKRGVMLVVYSATPNESGDHEVLFQDFHFLTKEGSPVLNFDQFTPAAGFQQKGIIAVLIGLLLRFSERDLGRWAGLGERHPPKQGDARESSGKDQPVPARARLHYGAPVSLAGGLGV
jgi:hypothetical protein